MATTIQQQKMKAFSRWYREAHDQSAILEWRNAETVEVNPRQEKFGPSPEEIKADVIAVRDLLVKFDLMDQSFDLIEFELCFSTDDLLPSGNSASTIASYIYSDQTIHKKWRDAWAGKEIIDDRGTVPRSDAAYLVLTAAERNERAYQEADLFLTEHTSGLPDSIVDCLDLDLWFNRARANPGRWLAEYDMTEIVLPLGPETFYTYRIE